MERKENTRANHIKDSLGSTFHKIVVATTPINTTAPKKSFLWARESANPPRIGPKIAIGALSGISVKELQNALSSGDINIISSISGIGKKTAERIIVELRDSFNDTIFDEIKSNSSDNNDSRLRDAVLALSALGYSNDASSKMVMNVAKNLTPDMTVEEIIRSALIK